MQCLSVAIITLNAAKQLSACLKSVGFANEIVIVDSGSTDETLDIARQAGANIIHQEWLGFGLQKQRAVEATSHDWVLCLDADERVSDPLRENILRELESPRFFSYSMPRRNRFMGRWLTHGEGYPDLNVRLFHKKYAQWSTDQVHEHLIPRTAVGHLKGDLLHESEQGLAEYVSKQNAYTTLQAARLFELGKRMTLARMLFSPSFRFIKFYILRLGFLDGVPGLVHILIGCFNSFTKYAKLRELENRHAEQAVLSASHTSRLTQHKE